MSQTESKIKLIFEGEERGVGAAAAKSEAGVRKLSAADKEAAASAKKAAAAEKERVKTLKELSSNLGTAGKWAAIFGAATGAGAAAIGASLPALGSLALGFGIAKAAIGGSTEALDAYDKALKDGKGDFTEYNRLLKAMTPEQRAFTEAVVATKKPLSDLQKTAGRSFLPGVTQFLTDSQTLFPILDGAVGRTGKIMGDTAAKLGGLFKTDKFKSDLDQFLKSTEPITAAIGDSFVKLTGKVVEFGAKMAPAGEGFATFIGDLESGVEGFLDGLAPHADDFKSIFESLGSIMQDVLPILGQLAGELSGQLAPMLRDVAGWIRENKGAISEWVPFIAQAVVGLAGLKLALASLKVVNVITDLAGLAKALGGIGPAAEAGGKAAGSAWKLGFTGALGAGAAGVGGAILADQLIPKDVGKYGSQAARDMLHEMAQVFQGEGSRPFQAWDVAQWIANPISLGVEVGRRELMKLFDPPPPIPVKVDTQPASAAFTAWESHVGDSIATANLDADPTRAMGTVHEWEGGVSRTRGVAQLDADASRGNNVLGGWKGSASATVGTATLNANPGQANSARSGWQSAANGTVGTARLNANPGQANAALGGWRGSANATVGTAQLRANDSSARATVSGFTRWASGLVVTVRAVLQKIGFAGGGPVPGLADGGAISGPGSGTSDSAGMFALSAGEWVMTAQQVRNAGGFAGMAKLAAALDHRGLAAGGSPMRASARAAMRTPTPASSGGSSGGVEVRFVGNTSDALATVIMQLQRTGKIQLKAA